MTSYVCLARKMLLELIFNELREPQPVSRGTCLDGAAGILESPFLASHLLSSNIEDVKLYRSNLVSVLNFAIDKLNDKAVYANTLVFAGRMLSLALFRIEGVGRKLLRALPPVKRMSMRRLLDEMANNQISESLSQPPNMLPFPAYLRELCFSMDLNSYCKVFSSTSVENDSLLVQEGDLTVEMSGNWLIRWTASDSDLPFAFYRAYHRQLATYLRPQPSGIVNPSTLISMPGFLFIAASFLDKCDSLVHRSLRSVTTLGPNANNFNAGESANLAMGAKPKVLELAHRRLVSTALDIVGGPPRSMTTDGRSRETKLDESGQRRCFFGGLLNLWIRAISKRTSMWDTRSVFLLLDLLDGLFYTVLYTAPTNPSSPSQSNLENADPSVPQLVESSLDLFDLGFILTVVRKILVTADNTVCVMRAIAFVYSQFEVLTAKTPILEELCLETLLEPAIFQHLFLHWNSGVRGYYMRLLVWRLSRLGGIGNTPNAAKGHSMIEGNNLTPARPPKSKEVIKIILTFNSRLDAVRNRHDELSPEAEFLGASQDEYRKKRSTICSTRGVSDQPWAIGELPAEVVCEEAVNASNDDQITSGRSPGNESQQNSTGDKPSVAKVVSWLRVVKRLGGGNSLKAVTNKGRGDVRRGGPIGEEGSEVYNQRIIMDRMRDESVNEGIIKSGKAAESQLDKVDEKIQLDELSEIENQRSQASSEERFENQDAIERKPGKSDSSPRSSIGQSPDSPTFFKFEFEIGADIPRSDSFDTPVSTPAPSEESPSSNAVVLINGNAAAKAAANSGPQNSTNGQNNNSGNGNSSSSGHQGRVSSRFSKRASLLPPAALSMLKENEAFPDVPSLPSQYKNSQKQKEIDEVDSVYPKKLHQYAIRALVEYEQSLEEEFEWKEKLKEEEMLMIEEEEEERKQQQHQGGGRGGLNEGGRTDGTDENGNKKKSRTEELESIVPRLAVSWPLSFSEDE
ncbi:hypothetical protein BY996DRAFT_6414481 [Phakopsora pachyrhizi]|nr:hypothetical protein BY996DRAFT_6414481 [Phakopsora pachyrhizi]